jgi:hypothetical protein
VTELLCEPSGVRVSGALPPFTHTIQICDISSDRTLKIGKISKVASNRGGATPVLRNGAQNANGAPSERYRCTANILCSSNERRKTLTLVCYRSYDVRDGLEESGERAKTVGSVLAISVAMRLDLCFKCRNLALLAFIECGDMRGDQLLSFPGDAFHRDTFVDPFGPWWDARRTCHR